MFFVLRKHCAHYQLREIYHREFSLRKCRTCRTGVRTYINNPPRFAQKREVYYLKVHIIQHQWMTPFRSDQALVIPCHLRVQFHEMWWASWTVHCCWKQEAPLSFLLSSRVPFPCCWQPWVLAACFVLAQLLMKPLSELLSLTNLEES